MSKEQIALWTGRGLSARVSALEAQTASLQQTSNNLSGQVVGVEDRTTANEEGIIILDEQVSILERGQIGASYHRNSNQTITTAGSPSTVNINWTDYSSWSDITRITHNSPNGSNFTVNAGGVYNINVQIQYNNLSSGVFTDRTFRLYITLTRGGNTSQIFATNGDFGDNTPNNAGMSAGGVYELQAGDVIVFQISQFLASGSFVLVCQSAQPDGFDLNTFWSWTLINPL